MKKALPLVTYKLTLCYDGTSFKGWQIQGSLPTVQLALEKAVAQCWKKKISMQGSGRTDTGVHALGQVAHFQAEKKFTPAVLIQALNNNLPDEIRILKAAVMPLTFHSRFNATGKEYIYRIVNHSIMSPFELNRACHIPLPLDFSAMRRAASYLIGEHDFASFTSNPGYARASTVRRIDAITIQRENSLLTFRFKGSGFLYRMVRNIMGGLIKVGQGRLTPEEIKKILEARSRPAAPNTAPSCGLYLTKVFYGSRSITLCEEKGTEDE